MQTNIKIQVVKLDHGKDLPLPSYATLNSAGMDLYAAIDQNITLKSLEKAIIPNGICIALPNGYEAQVRPRSGLAAKNGITVLNTPGTVDSDYRGELKTILINLSKDDFVVERGMRIAQMIIAKYEQTEFEEVEEFSSTTARGAGGFGSTGVK